MRIVAKPLSIVIAGLWSSIVAGNELASQVRVPCGLRIQFICDAAAITDAAERDNVLVDAIAQGLESGEAEVRREAFWYLVALDPDFDPRPLRRSLERFDMLDEVDDGRSFMAMTDLRYASREERLWIYKRAIIEGEVLLGRVSRYPRVLAMQAAAADGLGEIRSLISEYYPRLAAADRRVVKLEALMLSLDLREGGEDRRDASTRAVRRLAAIQPEELALKLEQTEAWRGVVGDIAWELRKDRNSKECDTLKEVLRRFGEHLSTVSRVQVEQLPKGAPLPEPTKEDLTLREWLARTGGQLP